MFSFILPTNNQNENLFTLANCVSTVVANYLFISSAHRHEVPVYCWVGMDVTTMQEIHLKICILFKKTCRQINVFKNHP